MRLARHVVRDRARRCRDRRSRIAVDGKRGIARRAQGLELVVGEQRRQAVGARLVEMAAAAIGFGRIVEQHIAAQLAGVKPRFAFQPEVELAACRGESSGPRSDSARPRTAPRRPQGAGRDERPRRRTVAQTAPRKARAAISPATAGDTAAVHFERVEQRRQAPGLAACRRGRPRTGRLAARYWPPLGRAAGGLLRARRVWLSAASCARLTVSFSSLSGPMLKVWLPLQIHQRRHRAHALARQMRPAAHRRRVARRPVGMLAGCGSCAGQPARGRQAGIEENLPAKLRHRRQRCGGRAHERTGYGFSPADGAKLDDDAGSGRGSDCRAPPRPRPWPAPSRPRRQASAAAPHRLQ